MKQNLAMFCDAHDLVAAFTGLNLFHTWGGEGLERGEVIPFTLHFKHFQFFFILQIEEVFLWI